MFTHLGNGCPMQLHRHDNIIQRVLSLSDRLWISFIGDGAHVDFPALGNYLKCTGLDRAVIVTDAISAAGTAAISDHPSRLLFGISYSPKACPILRGESGCQSPA